MRIDRRSFITTGICAAGAAALPLRAAPVSGALPEMLSPAEMRADLGLLETAYVALHPGLDRYLGRAAFADRIAGLKQWAGRERRPGEFFRKLGELTAAVRCGHTYPNPVNQSDAMLAGLLDGRDRVPFTFRWIGGQMVVTRTLVEGLALSPGMVIEEIDGVAPRALLARLLPLARADGSNDGKTPGADGGRWQRAVQRVRRLPPAGAAGARRRSDCGARRWPRADAARNDRCRTAGAAGRQGRHRRRWLALCHRPRWDRPADHARLGAVQ